MTAVQLAEYIRFQTKTDATTLTDSQLLMLVNVAKNFIVSEVISQIGEAPFEMESYTDLVANQRIYKLNGDSKKFKSAAMQLDGIHWLPLLPISKLGLDDDEIPISEEDILARFSGLSKPYYDIFRNSIYIYSKEIIGVTGGLKLKDKKMPSDLTDLLGVVDLSINPSQTENGIPGELHEVLARTVIIDFKGAGDKPIPLTIKQQMIEKDLTKAIRQLAGKDNDQSFTRGEDYNNYDNGYNL